MIVQPTGAGPMLEEMVTSNNCPSQEIAGIMEPSFMKLVGLEKLFCKCIDENVYLAVNWTLMKFRWKILLCYIQSYTTVDSIN